LAARGTWLPGLATPTPFDPALPYGRANLISDAPFELSVNLLHVLGSLMQSPQKSGVLDGDDRLVGETPLKDARAAMRRKPAPADAPDFIAARFGGTLGAVVLGRWLWREFGSAKV
jgi:hypothetical protein